MIYETEKELVADDYIEMHSKLCQTLKSEYPQYYTKYDKLLQGLMFERTSNRKVLGVGFWRDMCAYLEESLDNLREVEPSGLNCEGLPKEMPTVDEYILKFGALSAKFKERYPTQYEEFRVVHESGLRMFTAGLMGEPTPKNFLSFWEGACQEIEERLSHFAGVEDNTVQNENKELTQALGAQMTERQRLEGILKLFGKEGKKMYEAENSKFTQLVFLMYQDYTKIYDFCIEMCKK